MIPPQNPDWRWACQQTLDRLAGEAGSGETPWLRHAWRWIYERLSPEVRLGQPLPADVDPKGPPLDAFPVVYAHADPRRQMIGLVRVVFQSTLSAVTAARDGEEAWAAQCATEAVADNCVADSAVP